MADNAPNFWDVIDPILSSGAPDEAYDAKQEEYFRAYVLPRALKTGYSPDLVRKQFLSETKRPGKSRFPRSAVVGAEAFQSLVKPILGAAEMMGAPEFPDISLPAREEAERQGISAMPYEMAGRIIGETPYWIGGLSAAKSAALAKAGKSAEALTGAQKAASAAAAGATKIGAPPKLAGEIAWGIGKEQTAKKMVQAVHSQREIMAGATIQGLYDAFSADAGERVHAGLMGAVYGGGAVALFEGAPTLLKALIGKHGLSTNEASAVLATIKGTADEASTGIAGTVLLRDPAVKDTIAGWFTHAYESAKKNGMTGTLRITPKGALRIKMIGEDGKPYILGGQRGIQPGKFEETAEKLSEVLQKGGEVGEIDGEPVWISQLYNHIQEISRRRGDMDVPIVIRGKVGEGGPLAIRPRPGEPTPMVKDVSLTETTAVGPPAGEGAGSVVGPASLGIDWRLKEGQVLITDFMYGSRIQRGGSAVGSSGGHFEYGSDALGAFSFSPDRSRIIVGLEEGRQISVPLLGTSRKDVRASIQEAMGRLTGERPSKVTKADIPPSDFFERLPNGMIRDRETGKVYPSETMALAAKGMVPERFAGSGEYTPPVTEPARYGKVPKYGTPQLSSLHDASWYGPGSKRLQVPSGSEHRDVAFEAGSDYQGFLDSGKVAQRGYWVGFGPKVNMEALDTATEKALQNANARGSEMMAILEISPTHTYQASIPREEIGEFLANPRKYVVTNSGGRVSRFGETQGQPIGVDVRTPAPSSLGTRERPQYNSIIMSAEEWMQGGFPKEASALTPFTAPGEKSTVLGILESLTPDLIYHETLHVHNSFTGIQEYVNNLFLRDPMSKKLLSAWNPELRKLYEASIEGEEVFVGLAQAIRGGRYTEDILQQYANADGGMETLLSWFVSKTDDVLTELATKSDSIHKRVLQRKLNYVSSKAEGIERARASANAFGSDVRVEDGKYILDMPDGSITYYSRDSLIDAVEKTFGDPFNAPSLLDETLIPEGVPRFGKSARLKANKTEAGIPTFLHDRDPVEGGRYLFSFLFRPFYNWLGTVAQKEGMPELYTTFKKLDVAHTNMMHYVQGWAQKIRGIGIHKLKPERRRELGRYKLASESAKPQLEKDLNITAAEKSMLSRFNLEVTDTLYREFGITEPYLMNYLSKIRKGEKWNPEDFGYQTKLSKGDIDFWADHARTSNADPDEFDVLRIMELYLTGGAKRKFLADPIREASAIVNAKTPDGKFIMSSLQPFLKRHIDHVRGTPDFSQRMVDGTVKSVIEGINGMIERVNKATPLQLKKIEAMPRDLLGKWILHTYAGTMGLKAMVPIRDSLQLFITDYVILGNWVFEGMRQTYRAAKSGRSKSDLYLLAKQYGALMEKHDLANLYTGGYEELTKGTTTKISETLLKPLQWSNNANRLTSFAGWSAKIQDAIRRYAPNGDEKSLLQESGLYFMDDVPRNSFLQEILTASPSNWDDISYRMAKDMVDLTQWNYRRGGHPGLYKYAVGRLAGQYGTWPLNYIEYARRLAARGTPAQRSRNLSRLLIAHGAIVEAGDQAGIDTGSWILTGPASYSGSPIYQAVTKAPSALDLEMREGAEARKDIERLLPMSVPGGMYSMRMYKAIRDNDPNLGRILLGFFPMSEDKFEEGVHGLIP